MERAGGHRSRPHPDAHRELLRGGDREAGPAGYGPIVLNLNAHSEDIQSWQGSGDAITAFHGPFGAEELIRSGGGKVSNGCIRMLPEDQIKMDGIALGSPVDILP